jgi:hypothetical protein
MNSNSINNLRSEEVGYWKLFEQYCKLVMLRYVL